MQVDGVPALNQIELQPYFTQVETRELGARQGAARLLPGRWGGNSLPSVAADGAGRALVAWSEGKWVRVASRTLEGRWSSRVFVAGVDPAVATNPRGDALVLWRPPTNTVDRLVGSWQLRGQAWRRPRTLAVPSKGAVGLALAPQLALDNAGAARRRSDRSAATAGCTAAPGIEGGALASVQSASVPR